MFADFKAGVLGMGGREAAATALVLAGACGGVPGWLLGNTGLLVFGVLVQTVGVLIGLPGLVRQIRYDRIKAARLDRDLAAIEHEQRRRALGEACRQVWG